MSARGRLWEIDCLRGVAVALMVVSNFLFDLIFFADQSQLQSGVLDWFARFIAGFFIALAGLSLTLSHARVDAKRAGFGKNLRRGLMLMGLGMVISGATWFAVGEQMVLFGVLHLIGAGVILAHPFLGRPGLSLLVGVLVLAVNPFVNQLRLSVPWFLWLGLQPHNYGSVDYAPLIPWFGVMLIGVFLGQVLYPRGVARWPWPDYAHVPLCRMLSWCGRRSLWVYFTHQPVLLAGIILTKRWW
ncbi:MAG: heparan-alpha-glucosaminide N-acetyltransferase [Desulfobulbaceae bacterium]|nr:heparan-alpha-glucosaminide N-acetyltransferase [Desulfobulbaceae bacterium]